MDDDTLARARAVVALLAEVEREATPGPWNTGEGMGYGGDGDMNIGGPNGEAVCVGSCYFTAEGDNAEVDRPAILALRNAAPALLRLAEAVERLVEGDPAWAWSEVGMVFACQVCGSQTGTHAPDCPALAIDRALADLAALDGGDHED